MSKRIIHLTALKSEDLTDLIIVLSKLRYGTDPTFDNPLDIVNKRYVDEVIEDIGGGAFLRVDGGNEMTAPLPMGGFSVTKIGGLLDNQATPKIFFNPANRSFFDLNGQQIISFTSLLTGLDIYNNDGWKGALRFTNLASNEVFEFPSTGGTLAKILNTSYGAGWSGNTASSPSADKLYTKIAALDAQITALSLYLGKYVSLVALQTAYPTSTSGHWAIVDPGAGTNATEYIWDDNEGWVIGSGSAGVASVFGRTGVVTAMAGDYTTAQITEVTNLYFTVARVYLSALAGWTPAAGAIANGDTLQQVLQKLSGNISALLTLPTYPGNDNQKYEITIINGVVSWTPVTYVKGTSIANKAKLQADLTSDWDSTQTYIGTTSGAITGTKGGEKYKGLAGNGNWYVYEALGDNEWTRYLMQ